MFEIIGQIIGFVALFFIVRSFQSRHREKILSYQFTGSIFYFLNLILLGALTGGISMMFGVIRNYIFSRKGKKAWANSVKWVYLFLVIFIIIGIFTYKNIFSILPTAGMCLGTIGFWMTKPSHIRWIMLSTSPFWISYNYISGSIAGVILEVFILVSLLVGIIRFDILKHQEKQNSF